MTLLILLLFILFIVMLIYLLNSRLQTTDYTFAFKNLPKSFDGLKIVHLSDLHGVHIKGLAEEIEAQQPDLIVCTGDIFDGVHGQEESYTLLEAISGIAPVYYVSGNHEQYLISWPKWKEEIKKLGIRVLTNEMEIISKDGDKIEIAGVDDPGEREYKSHPDLLKTTSENFQQLPEKKNFRILLFHRASLFNNLPDGSFDLLLSGHIHGGQWRFFDQGIAGPGNDKRIDFFPEFDSGPYFRHDRMMIVSRGLGDRMKIPRINNRPELVITTLKTKEDLKAEDNLSAEDAFKAEETSKAEDISKALDESRTGEN